LHWTQHQFDCDFLVSSRHLLVVALLTLEHFQDLVPPPAHLHH
jgi:hypothetical protein